MKRILTILMVAMSFSLIACGDCHEKLPKYCPEGHNICGYCGLCDNAMCPYGCCKLAMPRWVPVCQSLPHDQQWVIVLLKDEYGNSMTLARWVEGIGWDYFFDFDEKIGGAGFDGSTTITKDPIVTHWQAIQPH